MSDTPTDAIVVLAELRPRPDQRDAFLAYAAENLPICRGYPGNLQFDVLLDVEEPGVVRFCERWQSVEAQQAYMAWRTAAGDFATLMAFLTVPPTFATLRPLELPRPHPTDTLASGG